MATSHALSAAVAEAIEPYEDLLTAFAAGQLAAEEFEPAYIRIYLSDERDYPDEAFPIVDGFFAQVDSFVADAALRGQVRRGIGPEQLRAAAVKLLAAAGKPVQPPQRLLG